MAELQQVTCTVRTARNLRLQHDAVADDLFRATPGPVIYLDLGSTDLTYDWLVDNASSGDRVVSVDRPSAPTDAEIRSALSSVVPWRVASIERFEEIAAPIGDCTLQLRPQRSQRVEALELYPDHMLLCPGARYHMDELGPLAEELAQLGIPSVVLIPVVGGGPIEMEASRYDVSLAKWPDAPVEVPPVLGVVTLNDWGPARELIELAQMRGVPTFAKVEGVQDFDDVDTKRERFAYQRADVVLCQGLNDVAALPGCRTHIVGNSRLERVLAEADSAKAENLAVVNSNFTYGVLTDVRDEWLGQVLKAGEDAGYRVTISQHHADRPLPPGYPLADDPMRHLLTRADVLVSRFSTVPYEALARGVEVVYYNPHGELVPTFAGGDPAYQTASDITALRAAFESTRSQPTDREAMIECLSSQVDVTTEPSERRAAAVIAEVLTDWQVWI